MKPTARVRAIADRTAGDAVIAASSPQEEPFVLDGPLLTEVRGEQSLMAYPFFALTKTPWKRSLVYKTDSVLIEIGPGPKGVATIYDKEVLLYLASLMVEKLEAGEGTSQEFYFTALDLFRVTGVNSSARSYSRLSDALERLQGTQIKTNIEAGGEGQSGFFSWISEAQLHYIRTKNGDRRLKAVRVRICDWLYRAILRDRRVMEYATSYFQLGPVERRVYEVARSTCKDEPVDIGLDALRLQLGCQTSLKHFRQTIKAISENDTIPGYRITVSDAHWTPNRRKGPGPVTSDTITITPKPANESE